MSIGEMKLNFRRLTGSAEVLPDQLVRAYKAVWGEAPAYGERFSDEEVRSAICDVSDFWIALAGEELVGFVGGGPLISDPDTGLKDLISTALPVQSTYFVAQLGVLSAFRKRGLGKQLMIHIVSTAENLKFDHAVLQTTTHILNPALILYRDLGFSPLIDKRGLPVVRIIRQVRVDNRAAEDIRALMVKPLSPGSPHAPG